MDPFRLNLLLVSIVIFKYLITSVQGIKCKPVNPYSISLWPTKFSASANLFQYKPPKQLTATCANFRGSRVGSVLQLEFSCSEKNQHRLASIIAKLQSYRSFGVRTWDPLLVEACTGFVSDLDDLGPVGIEQHPVFQICLQDNPIPNCSFQLNFPIVYHSRYENPAVDNETKPLSTWEEYDRVIRPSVFMLSSVKKLRNNAMKVFSPLNKVWFIVIVFLMLWINSEIHK